MKFTCDFKSLQLNLREYQRVLMNTLSNANENAGKRWLNTVLEKTPIPTWSGASRATFEKLARELGTSVPYGPLRSRKDRRPLGRACGSGSHVVEDSKRVYVGFVYESTLQYLHYNEYNHAVAGPPPQPYSNNVRFTPYFFQARGIVTWKEYAKTVSIPNPYRYITARPM